MVGVCIHDFVSDSSDIKYHAFASSPVSYNRQLRILTGDVCLAIHPFCPLLRVAPIRHSERPERLGGSRICTDFLIPVLPEDMRSLSVSGLRQGDGRYVSVVLGGGAGNR